MPLGRSVKTLYKSHSPPPQRMDRRLVLCIARADGDGNNLCFTRLGSGELFSSNGDVSDWVRVIGRSLSV